MKKRISAKSTRPKTKKPKRPGVTNTFPDDIPPHVLPPGHDPFFIAKVAIVEPIWRATWAWDYRHQQGFSFEQLRQQRIAWLKAFNQELTFLGVKYKMISGLDTLLLEAHWAKEYGLKLIVALDPFSYTQEIDLHNNAEKGNNCGYSSQFLWPLAAGLNLHPEIMEVIEAFWIGDDLYDNRAAFYDPYAAPRLDKDADDNPDMMVRRDQFVIPGENTGVHEPSLIRHCLRQYFPDTPFIVTTSNRGAVRFIDSLKQNSNIATNLDCVVAKSFHGLADAMGKPQSPQESYLLDSELLMKLIHMQRTFNIKGGMAFQAFGFARERRPITPGWVSSLQGNEDELYRQLKRAHFAGLHGYHVIYGATLGGFNPPVPDNVSGIWDHRKIIHPSLAPNNGEIVYQFEHARTSLWFEIRRFISEEGE